MASVVDVEQSEAARAKETDNKLVAPTSLSPQSAHAGADIHLGSLAGGACGGTGRHNRPGRLLEQSEQLFGNEARPRGIEVTIALRVLAVDEETLRHDQMQV